MSTVDPNMMNGHKKNHTNRLIRKMFDIRSSELNSSKEHFKKSKSGHIVWDEADADYEWFVFSLSNDKEDEDVIDKDPQYNMFLKELTENGNSYKLKISKNDETPRYLEYENSDNNEDMREMQKGEIMEVSRREMINEPRNVVGEDSCFQLLLNCAHSEDGAFTYEGEYWKYEKKVTRSGSDPNPDPDSEPDSDIVIVNDKQIVSAKKELSLREKLMRILRKPYNKREYEELSEYVEDERPICRLLPLRHRSISSALDGAKKSILDDGPVTFRRKLEAAKNERPKALNLLRMFRFWLEHVPNEDIFAPWLDDEFLKVVPSGLTR